MGTISVIGNVIKDNKSHEFKICDSYAFRNASDFLCIFFDFDRFINIIEKYGPIFDGDSFVSSNIEKQIESLKSNFEDVYNELKNSPVTEFRHPGRIEELTIDLDKKLHISNGEEMEFIEIQRLILQDLFD